MICSSGGDDDGSDGSRVWQGGAGSATARASGGERRHEVRQAGERRSASAHLRLALLPAGVQAWAAPHGNGIPALAHGHRAALGAQGAELDCKTEHSRWAGDVGVRAASQGASRRPWEAAPRSARRSGAAAAAKHAICATPAFIQLAQPSLAVAHITLAAMAAAPRAPGVPAFRQQLAACACSAPAAPAACSRHHRQVQRHHAIVCRQQLRPAAAAAAAPSRRRRLRAAAVSCRAAPPAGSETHVQREQRGEWILTINTGYVEQAVAVRGA